MVGKIGNSNKPFIDDKNDKNKGFLESTKQRAFNKRLNLNS